MREGDLYQLVYEHCKECYGKSKPKACGGDKLLDGTSCKLWAYREGPRRVAANYRKLGIKNKQKGVESIIIQECHYCLGEPRDLSFCASPKCAFYSVRAEAVEASREKNTAL